ncbi:unnamed protein product [Porites evermanni]|uniref:Uncharacterized protein n=1 Tax=Porites evermanni TaxID=104178 RepID=A0ABN8LLB8_9CNID|nr:unnamed protein product [Porites evermanni]
MSMLPHVNAVCKSAFYNLCNISRIKKFLSSKFTEILVHAFVASKLDYCNSLLYNVPKYVLKKLQSVQNVAAHLITCSRKYDHIAPVLSNRHWIPVNEHIKFKILLLYTNKHLSTFKIWLWIILPAQDPQSGPSMGSPRPQKQHLCQAQQQTAADTFKKFKKSSKLKAPRTCTLTYDYKLQKMKLSLLK